MRMALNGWVRLWIILSAAWLLVIGCLAYVDLSELTRTKEFEIVKEGVGKVTVIFPASQTDSEIQSDIRANFIPELDKDPKGYSSRTVTKPYDLYFQDHVAPRRAKYLNLAFLPVFGLVGLVWSVVWIRRGFSQRTSS
jgi:hypothetical protein